MKSIVILSLTLLYITAAGQQQLAINNYDSAYFKNDLIGWWKLSGNQNSSNTLFNNTMQVTPTEILFYSGDSITRKTAFTITRFTSSKRMSSTNNFLINLTDRDETWDILFFNSSKKAASIIINTEPGCFCNCPYQVYNRLNESNFVTNKIPQQVSEHNNAAINR